MKDALNNDRLRICGLVGGLTVLRGPSLSSEWHEFPGVALFGHLSGFIDHYLTDGIHVFTHKESDGSFI
jgi:hypothetical protein